MPVLEQALKASHRHPLRSDSARHLEVDAIDQHSAACMRLDDVLMPPSAKWPANLLIHETTRRVVQHVLRDETDPETGSDTDFRHRAIACVKIRCPFDDPHLFPRRRQAIDCIR